MILLGPTMSRKNAIDGKEIPINSSPAKNLLNDFIAGAKNCGESPESFCQNHRTNPDSKYYNEGSVCPNTIRNYIKKGIISLDSSDLARGFKEEKEVPTDFKKSPNKRILGKSIDEMPEPEYIDGKIEPDHRQIDTMVGKIGDQKVLLTLVEVRSHYCVIVLFDSKKAESVNKALTEIFTKENGKLTTCLRL